MHDMFTAFLLIDHFNGRHRHDDIGRREISEPELPWSRVLAWHRRHEAAARPMDESCARNTASPSIVHHSDDDEWKAETLLSKRQKQQVVGP